MAAQEFQPTFTVLQGGYKSTGKIQPNIVIPVGDRYAAHRSFTNLPLFVLLRGIC